MDKIDQLITKALTDEDRALLARHGEPGYLSQAFGLFRGPMAWTVWLVYVVGLIAFLVAIYALWQMTNSADVLAALKWGVASVLLFQFTTMSKTYLGTRMESNRLLCEVKRVELQIAMLRESMLGNGRG